MRRRDFITLFGGATIFAVRDDVSAESRLVRLGVLGPVATTPAMLDSLRTGLREFGYIEGKNLLIEVRWLHGSVAENVSVASELVRANVDAIIAWATPAVIAARGASTTIPIVMVGVGDPVGSGLVASLARPGGNVTGISNMSADLNSKLVQLLVGLIPGADFVGVVVNSDNPGSGKLVRGTTDAIHSLGLRSQVIEARTLGEFESAFEHMHTDGTKAVRTFNNSPLR